MGNQTSEMAGGGDPATQKPLTKNDGGSALAEKFGKTTNWHCTYALESTRMRNWKRPSLVKIKRSFSSP